MLLAVAGLDPKTVTELTHSLASGDWNRFTASERVALILRGNRRGTSPPSPPEMSRSW